MITDATYAEYVYSEIMSVQTSTDPKLVGTPIIMLYIDQTANQAKSDRRALTVQNARALHADLGKLLNGLDNPNDFLPHKEYDGN